MKKRLNWKVILHNIAEAREQLERIEALRKEGQKVSEVELQIWLEHAYHHMNFAWNIRHAPTRAYTKLRDEDFNRWSKFPKEIEIYCVPVPAKAKGATGKRSKAGKKGTVSKSR